MRSLGWRVFFAGMLLLGVLTVLEPAGEKAHESNAVNITAVEGVAPSATVPCIQVDNPHSYEVAHISAMELAANRTHVDKAADPFDVSKGTTYHEQRTDNESQASKPDRAFHMLKFQEGHALRCSAGFSESYGSERRNL